MPDAASKLAAFRALHDSGCFVMPNPWDVGSAIYLQQLGFPALATTSAGFSFSRGRPDLPSSVARDSVLSHVRDVACATSVPVTADFQNGYADDPDGVARNVAACLTTGVCGLSIEDATGDDAAPLYERDLAVERIRAACEARDATEPQAVLTARCEAFLVGISDAATVVLQRLSAFAEAGADCLFAPGICDAGLIAEVVEAVAPKSINVLVKGPHPDLTVQRLSNLGVRRISVGSALSRVAWSAFMRAAQSVRSTGTFDALGDAADFEELNKIFQD